MNNDVRELVKNELDDIWKHEPDVMISWVIENIKDLKKYMEEK